MTVLKLGERALAEPESLHTLGELLRERHPDGSACVVLAGLAGVAALLAEAARAAERGEAGFVEQINQVRERHLAFIRPLFPAARQARVITPVQILLNDLEDVLHGVQLIRECSPRTMDLVAGFASRLGAELAARYLENVELPVRQVDPFALIRTIRRHGHVQVRFEETYGSIRSALAGAGQIAVVPGGLGAGEDGAPAMLPHDGADLTASLVAAAVRAEEMEILTDADGVTSADPSLVGSAFVIGHLSYQEAMELAYFGARIIHPHALIPAQEQNIPVRIRNIRNPGQAGTLISAGVSPEKRQVAGIASIDRVALVNIEGGGMVGVPGIAARIFGALARASVNIMMISQASSEHTVCLVFRQQEAERALQALRSELAAEIQAHQIQSFQLRKELAIIAVIGENMRGTPGISGKLFSALGQAQVNILAIAQGSSETNISFVIAGADETIALQTVHRAFLEDRG